MLKSTQCEKSTHEGDSQQQLMQMKFLAVQRHIIWSRNKLQKVAIEQEETEHEICD